MMGRRGRAPRGEPGRPPPSDQPGEEAGMANVVRAALVQQKWTGDKDSMVKNAVAAVRDAAAQGAQVTCLQELFFGPYFCQVQEPEWYTWAEPVPDGPTVRLMRDVARE